MQQPDVVTARSPLGDIEARVGIPPIEELLAERDTLVKKLAPLRAKHGPGGIFQDERKVELAKIAAALRATWVGEAKKVTEAQIEEASHSDPRYVDYIVKATVEKAEYVVLENTVQGISDTIQRGNVIARYLANEVTLTPRAG
jgi:hypothetical protein